MCTVIGANAREDFVDGEAYLKGSFGFEIAHRWRNYAIILALLFLFMFLHLTTTEYVTERSKEEALLFTRGTAEEMRRQSKSSTDVELGARTSKRPGINLKVESNDDGSVDLRPQSAAFHWKSVCYHVDVKGRPRRILDDVDR